MKPSTDPSVNRSSGAEPLPALRGRRSRPPGALIYGPITSRRLGRSLGVNLMRPGDSVCSFHCIYCEYPRRHCPDPYGDWPTPGSVSRALADALERCGRLDSVTISGAGEPTEHPEFSAVVDAVLRETRRARPGLPVRILTNGATAVRPEIRRALDRLDDCIVTLDADPERVDRPDAHAPLGSIVYGVSLLHEITAQCCFVDGAISNAGEDSVREWADLVGEVRPRRVQIFTPSRPPAVGDARPVSARRLGEIAAFLRARTGIEARVYS